jgi:DNA-binding NarL/FixJ family response regulator
MTATPSIRVVVVDDQAMMRAAFRQILELHGIAVVGEGATADEGVDVAARTRPDVVLMDVRMPGRDGLDATAELAELVPETCVLVLTTFDHDEYLDRALRAGAAGFLLKNATPEALVEAVRAVAAGEGVLDPAVVGRVMARFARRTRSDADRSAIDRLTEREKDVLALLCRGLTNSEIAIDLGVGDATAKTHVSSVLAKLGVRDRVQAVILAYETGFATGSL